MEMKISIRAARVNAGLTQTEAAAKIHVSKATICSWERGNSSPTLRKLLPLCEAYNVSLDQLILP